MSSENQISSSSSQSSHVDDEKVKNEEELFDTIITQTLLLLEQQEQEKSANVSKPPPEFSETPSSEVKNGVSINKLSELRLSTEKFQSLLIDKNRIIKTGESVVSSCIVPITLSSV